MTVVEEPLTIDLAGRSLVGILHRPTVLRVDTGVIVVVGGPQYRVGSHRQFTLLARALCDLGIPVLRFDYTGMGDSDGEFAGFESVAVDIRAAVDVLHARCPGLREVHLWGLCDGASAALMYAPSDRRVTGLILVNPWVRTTQGQAQAYLENYYGHRLRSARVWKRFAKDPAALFHALVSLLKNLVESRGGTGTSGAASQETEGFLARMLRAAEMFKGRTLILLSGMDIVATEFELLVSRSPKWQRAFARPNVHTERLPPANHTFSRREWHDWVVAQTFRFTSGQGAGPTHANCDSVGGLKPPWMRD